MEEIKEEDKKVNKKKIQKQKEDFLIRQYKDMDNRIENRNKMLRNRDTKEILNVYDDSNDKNVQGKVYRIINLHVGKSTNNIEIPVLFKRNENLHIANLFVENGTSLLTEYLRQVIQETILICLCLLLNQSL